LAARALNGRHPLDIIIFDLEFTAWVGSQKRDWSGEHEHKEIVEIGAVRVNLDDPQTPDQHFNMLVHPTINPQLSQYFIELTGISQKRLTNDSTSFETALAAFSGFSKDISHFYSYGNDGEILDENCTLVGVTNPFQGCHMINARQAIKLAYGLDHSITSADLPAATRITVPGTDKTPLLAHQALDDARAVASVLVPLIQDGSFKP
jgi:inhibitor of KinA sporulation pathway (predicted exonuclease)